jgi:protein phosphatase
MSIASTVLPLGSTRPPLDIAARTDRGCEREGNEDSYFVGAEFGFVALAVCDGMGGAVAGEVASRAAAEAIQAALERGGEPEGAGALGRRLLGSVEEASARVFEMARQRPSLSGMGTTATACALRGQDLFLAQVGDSRAYLLRRGGLTQLTRDQTLATLLLERGQLTPEDLATCEFRNIILQAVGTQERVEVDLTHVRVHEGDVILVCSDGLHGAITDARIRDVLDAAPSSDAACEALVAAANEEGGPDNITCIVARVLRGSPPDGPPVPRKAIFDDAAEDTQPATRMVPDEDAHARGVFARLAAIFRRRQAT